MAQTKIDVDLNQTGKPKKEQPRKIIRDLRHLLAIVESRGLDPDLHKEVIQIIQKYPEGSFDYVYKTLDNIINRCQQKPQKDQPKPIEDSVVIFDPNKENVDD